MSTREPPSLGQRPGEQAEHPVGRMGALGPTAAALNVLSCLGTPSDEIAVDLGQTHDPSQIARLAGLSREVVCRQLDRLTRFGYVEEASRQRFRVAAEAVRQSEIVATPTRSSWTRPNRRTSGEEDATGSST